MGLLSSEDKEKIKRAIPKGSNKIIYATVAKLYIAYPDPEDYTDTGLSGAVVLVDDTVGKTFFIKLVDIEGQRGVLWDQELSVNFQYNKDRTFFHSFELEEFYGGLLFEDVGEANHFFKRVTSKEKYGSKATVQNKNAFAAKKKAELDAQSKPDAAGPRGFGSIDFHDPNNAQKIRRAKNVIYYNDAPPPEWRDLYRKLDEEEGISESMIVENREFIKNYVTEHNYSTLIGLEPPIPRKYQYGSSNSTSRISSVQKKKKAPPPPPPSAPISSTASTPTPPPVPASHSSLPSPAPSAAPSPAPALPAKEPTTERKYRLPPAPSFLGEGIKQQFHTIPTNGGQSPYQQSRRQESYQQYQHQQTMAAINAVPPPPLPPKSPDVAPPIVNQPHLYASKPPPPPSRPSLPPRVPLNTGQTYTPQFGNPPRAPPTLPGRGVAPPPPPSRKSGGPAPPPPPSRKPLTNSSAFSTPPPPLPPQQTSNKYVQPFPLPPKVPSTPAPPQLSSGGPPAPPLPSGGPPAPPIPIGGPPAPPQLSSGGPPAPPSQPVSQPATGDPGRDALLASIRNAGIGQLKKVNKAEIKHF